MALHLQNPLVIHESRLWDIFHVNFKKKLINTY